MPERDRAAVRVDFLGVDLELTNDGDGLGGEGLVQLHQVDVVDRHSDFAEQVLDGEDGSHAHDLGRDAGHRIGHPLELGVDAELFCLRRRHHHHGGAGVVDAR